MGFIVAWSFIASPVSARTLLVGPVGYGVYSIQDPVTGKTVYVRDVQAYIKAEYYDDRGVEGFGKSISQKEFQKGSDPVAETASAAASVVDATTDAAYNAANMVPSWRRYTAPVRALLGDKPNSRNNGPF